MIQQLFECCQWSFPGRCRIELGAKIIEVDASAQPDSVRRIGERPRRIAEGVLKAVSPI
jgi:hypothetical protein